MGLYWIEEFVDFKINKNNLLVAEVRLLDDKKSSYIKIGITEKDDVVLRFEPWVGRNDSFQPIDYKLRNISDENISIGESIHLEMGSNNVRIDKNGNIEINDVVQTISSAKKDIKGNFRARGTGIKTAQFNNSPEKIESVSIDIHKDSTEHIYGGGERFKSIEHSGSRIKSQVTQGAGANRGETYKSSPRYVSTEGYGFIVNTYSTVECDFESTSNEVTEIEVMSNCAEILFTFEDNLSDCLSNLYKYDEKNKAPPVWAFGFWSSRNTYESWDEVMEIAEEYRRRNVPCDVIHIDPGWIESFDDFKFEWSSSFDNSKEYIDKLHDMGFKVSLWVYPYVPTSSPMYKDNKKEYFVNDSFGNNFIFNDKGKLAAVDFTNPEAFEWWSSELSNLIEDGIDVIKSDFGEYIPEKTVFSNGKSGYEMRNAYPEKYQEACVSAFKKTDKKPLLWSRSGWVSQNSNSIHWNGDAQSTWEEYRTTIKSGLNAAMSSYSFWSSDVGGYKRNPSDSLYGEWMKFSALGSPHIRAHGKSPREPWVYSESYEDSKKVLKERYKIVPYLYSYAVVAEEKGIPIMRPMVLEDDSFREESSQYMLGDHLLVAPFLTDNKERTVRLPESNDWICYWTLEEFEGGEQLEVKYSNKIPIPLFVRKGCAIPSITRDIQSTSDSYEVELRKYGKPRGGDSITHYYSADKEYNKVTVTEDGNVRYDKSTFKRVRDILDIDR